MVFLRRYGCHIILVPGGELQLHIPELKSATTVGRNCGYNSTNREQYQYLRVTLKPF